MLMMPYQGMATVQAQTGMSIGMKIMRTKGLAIQLKSESILAVFSMCR